MSDTISNTVPDTVSDTQGKETEQVQSSKPRSSGADLVIRQLEAHGVKWVFGIPGAKVDRVFDALEDSSITTVVTRHEANAAFMAGAVGRLTGKAGVALVTSGPGCTNLTTGLVTANTEGDPMLALGGVVKLSDRLKQVHQTLDTVSLFQPVTKHSAEITSPEVISEALSNTLRTAESGRPGATFLALPDDIMNTDVADQKMVKATSPRRGAGNRASLEEAAKLLNNAKQPAILVGLEASVPTHSEALHHLLSHCKMPVTGTFQSAGTIKRENLDLYTGRIGLWPNQPGDELLKEADVVLTIGYNPAEYEPFKWNGQNQHTLIHLDSLEAEIDNSYQPTVEVIGDIAESLSTLTPLLDSRELTSTAQQLLSRIHEERNALSERASKVTGSPVHPLKIVNELQHLLEENVTMCVDMGSFHIWIARYLNSFRPRQLLISNGQQTMGVALPWAIAAALVRPDEKIISVSGDGSFMQSSMELETAVRLGCNIMHIIWVDNHYNMVKIQEDQKYGRPSGVEFGDIDFKAYAESMGAAGFAVNSAEELHDTLRDAMQTKGPSVVAIPVDYADNPKLMAANGTLADML